MKNNNSAWIITAKSNLHVGNENTSNYGIIDKSVQRDALTNLPCINSSSLKGALNEFFAMKVKSLHADLLPADLLEIFGSNKLDIKSESKKGGCSFFDAQLLSIPVQSNKRLFFRATSPAIIRCFLNRLDQFGIDIPSKKELEEVGKLAVEDDKPIVYISGNNIQLGDFKAISKEKTNSIIALEKLIGTEIALFSEADFIELCCDENLPIIARNCLSNGESTNLWYEQILPQETIFHTFFLAAENKVSSVLSASESLVQIGANATIGYGYCKFTKL